MYKPEFNRKKFRALILYAAHKSRCDDWFGAVKLNKVLYYCDFTAFAQLYRPITGATYVNMPEGPVPKEFFRERQVLVEEGLAVLKFERVFRYVQHRLEPIAEDDEFSDAFEEDELAVIDDTLRFLKPMTGKEVSELSHREVGWILSERDEVIPYETAWVVPKGDFDLALLDSDANND